MQTFIDYGATGAAWVVAVWRFSAVLKSDWDKRIVKTWLLMLSFALFLTFEVDVVYTGFDRLTGVNNLSWLLSYLLLALAAYYLCFVFCSQMPRWAAPYLAVTAFLLAISFAWGPARMAETYDYITPTDASEIVFMGIAYAYFATMFSGIPLQSGLRALRQEADVATRLRTLTIILAIGVSVANLIIKLAIYSASYYLPVSLSLVHVITTLTRLLTAAAAILWVSGAAPNHFYRKLARPFEFWSKVCTNRELAVLQGQLHQVCPEVPPEQAPWLEQMRSLDLYIYRRVIGVLDCKKLLADRLAHDPTVNGFYQHLISIPQEADFDRVVAVCRGLGQRVKGGRL